MTGSRVLLYILAMAIGLGCDADAPADAGSDVSAEQRDAGVDTGACSAAHDPGPRPRDAGVAVVPPRIDCGEPVFVDGTGLRRRPYLQSTTDSSVRVAWTTTTGGRGVVRVAPTAAGPWTEVVADRETFERARTGDEPVDYVAYDALLTDLSPGTGHCYEVWEDGVPLATNLSLVTAWQEAERPLRILAFGDSGTGLPGQLELRDRVLERIGDVDIFLHLGDIAYGDGTFQQFHEFFFVPYQDFLHRIPTWPTPGNHEMRTDRAQPYLDIFYLPEQGLRDAEVERYYAFDWGGAHFVSLDSNSERLVPIWLDRAGRITDDMVDWARADLMASDSEWKIAFFHHTPYSSSERGINAEITNTLVPMLEESGVDLVLAGHDHHYERTVAMRGSCTAPPGPDAVTYLTNGAGGAELRPATGDWFTAFAESEVHSFLLLEIRGCFLYGQAIDQDGVVIDTFELGGCD